MSPSATNPIIDNYLCCSCSGVKEQAVIEAPPEPAPELKTYNCVLGTIQCMRGKAFRVRCQEGPDFFVDKTSLVRTFSARDPADGQRLAEDKRVRSAFLSALAPYGDWRGTSDSRLCAVLGGILHRCLEKQEEWNGCPTPEQLITEIETLDPRCPPSISLDELQEGDIIWTHLRKGTTPTLVERAVIQGQKLTRGLLQGPRERDSHRFVHVGMYVGDGKIAEAMVDSGGGPELRMVDFKHDYYTQANHDYRVTRLHDPLLTETAANIARELTVDAQDDLPENIARRYNMTTAILSVIRPSWNLEIPSLIRILRSYHQLQQGEASEMFGSFHCSYFIPFVYQLAEAKRLMPEIEGQFAIEPLDPDGTLEKVQAWAVEFMKRLEQEVEIPLGFQSKLLFKINARRTSPQDLRMFFHEKRLLNGDGFPAVEEFKLR